MTIPVQDDLVITTCAHHGVKVCRDMPSMRVYVEAVNWCIATAPHTHDAGMDCWVCCPSMVVDPHGICDY